jgi:hypothetical protein
MAINQAIVQICHQTNPDGPHHAFVIEDPTFFRSCHALLDNDPPKGTSIIACSSDPGILNIPQKEIQPLYMNSTHALMKLIREECQPKLDYVFLDYCGTPDIGVHDWVRDVELSSRLLKLGCPIYITFSKRNFTNIHEFVVLQLSQRIPEYFISDVYNYMDTSAMILLTIRPWIFYRSFLFLPEPPKSVSMAIFEETQPKIGQTVHVQGIKGGQPWTGIIQRYYNLKEVEVAEIQTKEPFTVKLSDITVLPTLSISSSAPQGSSSASSSVSSSSTSIQGSSLSSSSSSMASNEKPKKRKSRNRLLEPTIFIPEKIRAHPSETAFTELFDVVQKLLKQRTIWRQGLSVTDLITKVRCQHPGWPFKDKRHIRESGIFVTQPVKEITRDFLQTLVDQGYLQTQETQRKSTQMKYWGFQKEIK